MRMVYRKKVKETESPTDGIYVTTLVLYNILSRNSVMKQLLEKQID